MVEHDTGFHEGETVTVSGDTAAILAEAAVASEGRIVPLSEHEGREYFAKHCDVPFGD